MATAPSQADIVALTQALQSAASSIQQYSSVVYNAAQSGGGAGTGGGGANSSIGGVQLNAAGQGILAGGRALLGGYGLGAAAGAGVSQAASALGGPIGGITTLLTLMASGLERTTEGLRTFFDGLARSSEQIALVNAQGDVRSFFRQREMGNRLSDSARALMEAEQNRFEGRKEWDILMSRASARLSSFWENLKADLWSPLNDFARSLNRDAEGGNIANKALVSNELAEKLAREEDAWRKNINPMWHRRIPHPPFVRPRPAGLPGWEWNPLMNWFN